MKVKDQGFFGSGVKDILRRMLMGRMKELFYQDEENSKAKNGFGLKAKFKRKLSKVWTVIKRELSMIADDNKEREKRRHEYLKSFYDRLSLK